MQHTWTCSRYGAIKIFRLTPLPNAWQTENMIAVWQNTKSMFTSWCLFCYHLETNAACLVFGSCHREWVLHILLHHWHTFLISIRRSEICYYLHLEKKREEHSSWTTKMCSIIVYVELLRNTQQTILNWNTVA